MAMLKDMESMFGPTKTTPQADVLAGEGKKNTGLEGLQGGSKFGMRGGRPTLYIDTVEY